MKVSGDPLRNVNVMREEEGPPSPKDSGEGLGEVMMEGRGMSWDGRFWKRAGCILDRHRGY